MEGDYGEAPEEAAKGIFLERGSFHKLSNFHGFANHAKVIILF
jgi:hypothetical protein